MFETQPRVITSKEDSEQKVFVRLVNSPCLIYVSLFLLSS